MEFNKKLFTSILIISWIIISVLYISYDLFTSFKINTIQKSYISGQSDTINSLIKEAEKSCDGFEIYSGEKKVGLINIECLKPKEEDKNSK